MSMKIHNGYIIPNTTLDTIRQRIMDSHTAVITTARSLVLNHAAAWAVDSADRRILKDKNLKDPTKSPVEIVNAKCSNDTCNVKTEITAFEDGKDIYCMIFTSKDEIRDLLVAALGAQEFRYWDNTDRPDDIDQDQWNTRRAKWETLVGSDTPASRGTTFAFDMPSDLYTFTAEQLASAQPDLDTRAKAFAQFKRFKAFYHNNPEEDAKPDNEKYSVAFWAECIEKAKAEMKDLDAHPEAREVFARIKMLLPPVVTVELLSEPLCQ